MDSSCNGCDRQSVGRRRTRGNPRREAWRATLPARRGIEARGTPRAECPTPPTDAHERSGVHEPDSPCSADRPDAVRARRRPRPAGRPDPRARPRAPGQAADAVRDWRAGRRRLGDVRRRRAGRVRRARQPLRPGSRQPPRARVRRAGPVHRQLGKQGGGPGEFGVPNGIAIRAGRQGHRGGRNTATTRFSARMASSSAPSRTTRRPACSSAPSRATHAAACSWSRPACASRRKARSRRFAARPLDQARRGRRSPRPARGRAGAEARVTRSGSAGEMRVCSAVRPHSPRSSAGARCRTAAWR